MSVTVVVGGQYGSEGKGKVACELARRQGASVAVRVGGSNSGHTVIDPKGKKWRFQHLPTAAILPDVLCVLPTGAYIDVELLLGEIAETNLPADRLLIDAHAVLITDRERAEEAEGGLRASIGSTASGTGTAVLRRLRRDGTVRFANSDPRLAPYIPALPVAKTLRTRLARRERVIIEGTQGFGLSPLHSREYPNVTSRDTTAAAFVAEAGLSPLDVDDVTLVIRSHPIRVGGNSGNLRYEIDWDTVTRESGSTRPLMERTTVTNTIRRIARFDPQVVIAAIEANAPTRIVMNHLDYVDCLCHPLSPSSHKASEFIEAVERQIGNRIDEFGLDEATLLERSAII